jgi:hypothetical protein
LVWDANFSGSIIATACFQTVMSLFTVALLIFRVRSYLWLPPEQYTPGYQFPRVWLGVAFETTSMLATLILVVTTFRACWKKPIRSWMQGVKELAIRPILLAENQSASIFGKQRPADDRIRMVWAGACGWGIKTTLRFLKLGFTRRIP